MNYLFVVAHPDDEVLGAGGTIYTLSKRGERIHVAIMSGMASARSGRPKDEELLSDVDRSLKLLGVQNKILGDFPNIKLNNVPHLELVQFIENAIIKTKAEVILLIILQI